MACSIICSMIAVDTRDDRFGRLPMMTPLKSNADSRDAQVSIRCVFFFCCCFFFKLLKYSRSDCNWPWNEEAKSRRRRRMTPVGHPLRGGTAPKCHSKEDQLLFKMSNSTNQSLNLTRISQSRYVIINDSDDHKKKSIKGKAPLPLVACL